MAEKREDDLLNDPEHVRLKELPRMRMFDGVIQVVDRLLKHARRNVSLLLVLVQDFQQNLERERHMQEFFLHYCDD